MKKFLSIIALSLAFFGTAKAMVVQRALLRNGTVLNGFIQEVSNGIVVFQTDYASVVVNGGGVTTIDKIVKEARLDSAWVNWAKKMDAFEGTSDNKSLTLSDIDFRDTSAVATKDNLKDFNFYLKQKGRVSNVKIMERGANLKYLELTANTYTFSWDDVTSITLDRRPKTALSGIDCIYQLSNGQTFEGQKAGETKNTISLYSANGVMQSFNIEEVVKTSVHAINPDQDIFAQCELLDVVGTASKTLRGIIVEQNYTSHNNAENYILLQQENGVIQSIKLSEITSTRWEVNPRYAPLTDVILKEGQVMINRKEFQIVGVSEDDDIMTLDSLCVKNTISLKSGGTPITVEYHVAESNNVEAFQLVRVTETKVKRNIVYCFSYKDLVNAIYRPKSIKTSINKTTKTEYVLDRKGIYALYDAKHHRAIPIIVQ